MAPAHPAAVCDLRQFHFLQYCSKNTCSRFRDRTCIGDSCLGLPVNQTEMCCADSLLRSVRVREQLRIVRRW